MTVQEADPADGASGQPITLGLGKRMAGLCRATGSPLSEYDFANLYLFRDRHDYRFVDGTTPHILGTTYDGVRHVMPLIPLDADVVGALISAGDCLYPLGEDAPGLADRMGLTCTFNAADSDYVYDAARLTILAGAKVKRSQANAFAKTQNPRIVPIDSDRALGVLDGWLADVDRSPADTDLAMAREALGLLPELEMDGMMVETGAGEAVAFLLSSLGADGSRIVHFAKGRREHAGAYPWMFAAYAARCGATRLNFEQDLGKPGFAQSKRVLAPITQYRKYRVSMPGPKGS